VISALSPVIVAGGLLLTGWGILTTSRSKPPGRAQFAAIGVLEVLLVVHVAIAVVKLIDGKQVEDLPTLIGYLAGIVLLLPAGVTWAMLERTRVSGLVLSVVAFAVLGMTLRIDQLWTGTGA
jgi:ABC-type uncharacterized transport system permease subunit